MSKQYFENNQDLAHDVQAHPVHVLGRDYQFYTDHGVFFKTGLDFGSRVLIETIIDQKLLAPKILDVGCGYGPIGIILASHLATSDQVHMVDVNERALGLAQQNAQINGLRDLHIYSSNTYDQVTDQDFDLIVSNPPIRAGKAVVHQILAGAYDHLKIGGRLLVVIQKKQGAPSAQKKMAEVFGNVTELERRKGYWILSAVKS
ncbi:16S rRNA methyltransferase [Aerococcus urinaehominis]|uniref:16S rRNA methyltransferase n=1 Tax=Aerococcus urinaehominis TaxID=128944 RepID=A0A0X8FKZ7_9LACT|nr:class I SAM-dependent methyltransferase [Aerococcus urinaehominis]AMB99258.1 16S rRNA methyltransferase [Aerococcus urinaehominis]SDM46754.1 16S rRNA (guanine1207-N2)-methyltransferase [Aerococcus urinaehominis]